MPSIQWRAESEKGGYLVRTNAAGFRSDFEFTAEKSPDTFRALLFGDSQTAGDGNANADRYSDVVMRSLPKLEIYNYGLSGSGTDQQFLAYQDYGHVEHDLLIIALHVENIARVGKRFQVFRGTDGNEVIYAKPYYTLDADALTLHHVPVPRKLHSRQSIDAANLPHVNGGPALAALRSVARKLGVRDVIRKVIKPQPVPEYDSPHHPCWLLLRAVLSHWIQSSPTPVLLLAIPMDSFVLEASDPANYQARLRELARETGCHVHDPLADLCRLSLDERRALFFHHDTHYNRACHQALAASLAPVIEKFVATGPSPRRAIELMQHDSAELVAPSELG